MERSSKRGKIPQKDWPTIMERHESGETLASIARTYDCSPPAISYIVSRSRARSAAAAAAAKLAQGEPAAPASPPERGSDPGADAPGGAARQGESALAAPAADRVPPHSPSEQRTRPPVDEAAAAARRGNGAGARFSDGPGNTGAAIDPAGRPGNGLEAAAPRRTLHLTHLEGAMSAEPLRAPGDRYPPEGRDPARIPSGYDRPERSLPAGRNGGAGPKPAGPQRGREGGAIDQALRERVDGDIAAFLAAFDDALANDSVESRTALREATDRLLRAGARTRIELERLDARVPLPPRGAVERTAAWRQR